jgi:hypothetical protein
MAVFIESFFVCVSEVFRAKKCHAERDDSRESEQAIMLGANPFKPNEVDARADAVFKHDIERSDKDSSNGSDKEWFDVLHLFIFGFFIVFSLAALT